MTEQDKKKEEQYRKQQEEKETKKKIEALCSQVQGKDAIEAIDILQKTDALGTINTTSGVNMDKAALETDKKEGVNWVVTEAQGNGSKVDINIKTTQQVELEQKKQAMYDNLNQKFPADEVFIACRNYGKQQYPYGFKLHSLVGVLQEPTPIDENTWFYKATADITNAFGAKAKDQTMECKVTGTKENPQIVEFNVY